MADLPFRLVTCKGRDSDLLGPVQAIRYYGIVALRPGADAFGVVDRGLERRRLKGDALPKLVVLHDGRSVRKTTLRNAAVKR